MHPTTLVGPSRTCVPFRNCCNSLTTNLTHLLERIFTWLLKTNFYVGHKVLPVMIATERRNNLLSKYDAKPLKVLDIDALYIPTKIANPSKNVIVICLNTTYQDHHPRHLEPFLNNGTDVVVWNQTKLTPAMHEHNLFSILTKLSTDEPDRRIGVLSYCASADPAISAVAEINNPNIHLVVDRGHGSGQDLARSCTALADSSIARHVIRQHFDCRGITKIATIPGRMMFLTPEILDQVMDDRLHRRNFTRELMARRPNGDLHIQLPHSDHWTPLNYESINSLLQFFQNVGIIQDIRQPATEDDFPTAPPPSYFKRKCLPFLSKAWC